MTNHEDEFDEFFLYTIEKCSLSYTYFYLINNYIGIFYISQHYRKRIYMSVIWSDHFHHYLKDSQVFKGFCFLHKHRQMTKDYRKFQISKWQLIYNAYKPLYSLANTKSAVITIRCNNTRNFRNANNNASLLL